ncbi:hypothetical protein AJ80_07136 [Polytolypa hystricis UAMH7299]|uniref:Zn(2)-C6 fungal-type domain-containing protein n=1 Tax=Polytolypa hystricis (strain UAMH7299) TaxID=1447883 RepID=A0A2B7XQI3_POLH7|nr:hypothetical protein AJ80_07136 [Polytolypa hystricis UAMH7299]
MVTCDDLDGLTITPMREEKGDEYSPEPESPKDENNSAKRSASGAGLDSAEGTDWKSTRKRAAKACQSCRSRKVRCSVSDHGVPCYNCKLDGLECVVPERKRPSRTVKKERSLVTIGSQAFRLDKPQPSSSCADWSSQTAQGVSQVGDFDRENPRRVNYDTEMPSMPTSSPTQESTDVAEELSFPEDSRTEGFNLPPCEPELARWLGVMPSRVVDKMFNYLTAVHERRHSGSSSRFVARRQDLPGADYPATPNSGWTFEQSKMRSSSREQFKALEVTIRNVDSQIGDRGDIYGNDVRYPISSCAQSSSTKAGSALTPPPENQISYDKAILSLPHLESLFAPSRPKQDGRSELQENVSRGASQDRSTNGSGPESELQETFDSLIDFAAGTDPLLQSILPEVSTTAD